MHKEGQTSHKQVKNEMSVPPSKGSFLKPLNLAAEIVFANSFEQKRLFGLYGGMGKKKVEKG